MYNFIIKNLPGDFNSFELKVSVPSTKEARQIFRDHFSEFGWKIKFTKNYVYLTKGNEKRRFALSKTMIDNCTCYKCFNAAKQDLN